MSPRDSAADVCQCSWGVTAWSWGYLYGKCSNFECAQINIPVVPYGKTHRAPGSKACKGIPIFAVNTKLGTAMIDSLGGPDNVNKFLSTLNITPLNPKNLKVMERRARSYVESVAAASTLNAANNSFAMEMQLKNIESLSILLYNGVMKAPSAENVVGSGLNLACLRTILLRDGEDGLSNTFTCKNKEGQPHVTRFKRTLETVIPNSDSKAGGFL